jgi:hypothetical protein
VLRDDPHRQVVRVGDTVRRPVHPWSCGLVAMARLSPEYHEAVQGFRPSGAALWAAHAGPPRDGELICHGDFGPWNLVWHGTRPVACGGPPPTPTELAGQRHSGRDGKAHRHLVE